MVQTVIAPKYRSTLGSPAGELCLRLVVAHGEERVIRLSSAKCTIGSGENCTLRVRGGRLDPLCCLVLRGSHGTVVRNWSGNTRLNGRTFTDALLAEGDRLQCGLLELEVTALSPSAMGSQPEFIAAETNEQIAALLGQRQAIEKESWQLSQARATLEVDQAALIQARNQFDTAQAEWNDRQQIGLTELAAREQLLTAAIEQLQADRDEWRSEHAQGKDELQVRTSQLDVANVNAEQARLTWETERAQHEKNLAAERDQLAAKYAELTAMQQTIEQSQRQTIEQETGRLRLELEHDRATLEAKTAELESQRQEFDQQAQQLQLRVADSEQAEAKLVVERQELEQAQHELSSQRAKLQAEREQLAVELAQRHTELYQQQAQLAERQTELERQAALQTASPDESSSDLHQQLAQLTAERDELQRTIVDRDHVLAEHERSKSTLTESLQTAERALAEAQSETARLHEAANQQTGQHDQQTEQAQAELAQIQQKLDEQQSAIEQQQRDLEGRLEIEQAARRQMEAEFAERQTALDAQAAELAQKQQQFAAEQEAWGSKKLQVDTSDDKSAPEPAPVLTPSAQCQGTSDDAIFERLRRIAAGEIDEASSGPSLEDQHSSEAVDNAETDDQSASADEDNEGARVSDAYLRFQQSQAEDEDQIEPEKADEYPAHETFDEPLSAAASDKPHDEEESIENYMARLMQRVRGEAVGPPPKKPLLEDASAAPPQPAAPVQASATAEQLMSLDALLTPTGGGMPMPPTVRFEPLGELVPRSQSPERIDMAGLREVANMQAQSVIATSNRSRAAKEVVSHWMIVMIGLTTAAAMTYFGMHGNYLAYIGALAGLAIAGYWSSLVFESARGFFASFKSLRPKHNDKPASPEK